MSGSMLSSSALDERRRRILFRAWRRGVREMDLIMGRFADAHLPTMNEDELAEFERLLDVPDTQALAWIIGGEPAPTRIRDPALRSPVRVAMTNVSALRRDAGSFTAPAIRRLEEGGAVTLARAPEGYDAFVVADLDASVGERGERRAVTLCFVARDGLRAQAFIDALSFAAPEIEALYLPSWDCQPYDRVSPNAAVSARAHDGAGAARPEPRRAWSGRAFSWPRSMR